MDTDLDKHLTESIWTLPGAEAIISNRVNFALNLKGASPETRIVQLQLKQKTKEEFLSFNSDFIPGKEESNQEQMLRFLTE